MTGGGPESQIAPNQQHATVAVYTKVSGWMQMDLCFPSKAEFRNNFANNHPGFLWEAKV